jgi:hypothetical protein
MTPDQLVPESRLRRLLASRLVALRERADGGQALVLALIIVLIIGLLPAIILSSLNQEMPYASESVNYEAALAAAESGVQEYANLLDQYQGYQKFAPQAGGATSTNDPGLPGGSNLALGAWAPVAGSSPPEWFTYYPDLSEFPTAQDNATNPFGGDVLLVVTGRAGNGKTTQYRRIEAAFTLTGAITDVYFSDFEQPSAQDLDQWINVYPAGCQNTGGGCGLVNSGAHEFDEATDTTPCSGGTCYAPSEPMATALCQYDADQVNTFIDWYSANVSPVYPQPGYPGFDTRTPYSPSNPYYGPWYGSFPDPTDAALQFGVAPLSGSTNNGDQSACNTNYWITGDVFNGQVYSQDELTTCGTPQFTGDPALETAVPQSFPFPAEQTAGGTLVGWPGQLAPTANPSGPGYVSDARGYDKDPWGDCGGASAGFPNDTHSPHLGISQSLPQANQALVGEIESGTVAGCVYTGPTMIRFTYNTSTQAEVMDVWSPLTKDTYGSGSSTPENSLACGATASGGDLCGGTACTGSNAQVQGGVVQAGDFAQVTITAPLVIAVQNLPTASSDPNSWATIPTAESNATVSGCIDPWVNPDSTTSITTVTCTNGDAILSGAVGAQVTVSSSNNVVVARSLVYGCAVNANGTYQTNLSGCSTSLDVLGIIALNNIWMARPYNPTTGKMAPACADDTDLQPASITWSNMIPNCTVVNPTIDAAMAALNGFFEVEYWREGDASGGTLYFNGSDEVNNAGQFGTFSGSTLHSGYLLNLSYDGRLKGDYPPQYLPATDGIWAEVGWVTCGSTVPNPFTSGYPNGVPACTPLAGSYPS